MLSLSYNLINNENFKSEQFYRVSKVLFDCSRGISMFQLRIKPRAIEADGKIPDGCRIATGLQRKANCFRFNSGLANLILIFLIEVTGDLKNLTIVWHVDHNLFSEHRCATYSVTVKQSSKGFPQR